MTADAMMPWLLTIIGTLIAGICFLIYNRMGRIETTVERAIDEQRSSTADLHEKISSSAADLHTRITDVTGRVVRLETRCDSFHLEPLTRRYTDKESP